jgi:hypothetical protein
VKERPPYAFSLLLSGMFLVYSVIAFSAGTDADTDMAGLAYFLLALPWSWLFGAFNARTDPRAVLAVLAIGWLLNAVLLFGLGRLIDYALTRRPAGWWPWTASSDSN